MKKEELIERLREAEISEVQIALITERLDLFPYESLEESIQSFYDNLEDVDILEKYGTMITKAFRDGDFSGFSELPWKERFRLKVSIKLLMEYYNELVDNKMHQILSLLISPDNIIVIVFATMLTQMLRGKSVFFDGIDEGTDFFVCFVIIEEVLYHLGKLNYNPSYYDATRIRKIDDVFSEYKIDEIHDNPYKQCISEKIEELIADLEEYENEKEQEEIHERDPREVAPLIKEAIAELFERELDDGTIFFKRVYQWHAIYTVIVKNELLPIKQPVDFRDIAIDPTHELHFLPPEDPNWKERDARRFRAKSRDKNAGGYKEIGPQSDRGEDEKKRIEKTKNIFIELLKKHGAINEH